MRSSEPTAPDSGYVSGRMRQLMYRLRTEGGSPSRDAMAIGVGVFIGCTPFYGLHLALCWIVGRMFRLNRLKMYLAANISNPAVAPFLVLAQVQIGAWLRRGAVHPLTIDTIRTTGAWVFGGDLLLGSTVLGLALGAIAGSITWLATREQRGDAHFAMLVRRASDRYATISITAWEFARGKLRGDPLYRTVLTAGLVRPGGVAADIGCGQGLMLALLAEAAGEWRRGDWPRGVPQPPMFDRLIGVELRPRIASIARRALGGAAEIITADARSADPLRCRGVFLFDVLHMMSSADQEVLWRRVSANLEPGGVILVREADASAGWRFQAVRAGNWIKATALGHWRQTFHYRSAAEWQRWFEAAGFQAEPRGAGEGTPFGNVLFVITSRADVPG